MNEEEKIKSKIQEIKPFLKADGGDIEFIKFENGNVYVKLLGACNNCPMIDMTLKEVIENILASEISTVKKVIRVD